MSGHGDHDEAHGDDGHDHDDDHHAVPALEEPATPLWLTLLGIGLFLAGGILFIATRSDAKTSAELAPPAPSAPAAGSAVQAPPNPPVPQPAARP
jgi:hypothetical protein